MNTIEMDRREVKELAARMTPELMRRIQASVTDEDRERTAIMILSCCADAMMNGDSTTRLEAYDLFQQVRRWQWGRRCAKDWEGYPLMEVQ